MIDDTAWTRSPVLQGERVRLEPLDARHVPGPLAAAADSATWTWRLRRLDDDWPAVRMRLVARLAAHSRLEAGADAPPRGR